MSKNLTHLLVVGLVLISGYCATARVYVVTNTNDTISVNSLRGAVIAANRSRENNTIILGQVFKERRNPPHQWIYRLTISGADEDAARTGDLGITRGNLTIVGASSNVTIDATGLGDRVFQVFSNAHLTLENLTITGGKAPQAQFGSFYMRTLAAEMGGAIYNAGVLVLSDCIITNNSSGDGNGNPGNGWGKDGGDGGGIYNFGTLQANHCTIIRNMAGAGVQGSQGGSGGGIRNAGICVLTSCVVRGNRSGAGGGPDAGAGGGGYGGNGGGIFNSGTVILNECIVNANVAGQGSGGGDPSGFVTVFSAGGWGGAGGSGGGVYNNGQIQLNFSTVCGNTSGIGGDGDSFGSGGNGGAGGDGAGIFNEGKLSSDTSTISGNLCGDGGTGGSGVVGDGADGGAGGSGGGIFNVSSLNLVSCTIALNQAGAGGNGGNGFGYWFSSYAPVSGGQGGNGGGILNNADNTNAVIQNTLIALNLANVGGVGGTNSYDDLQQITQQIGDCGPDGISFDVAGDFTSQGFNLVGMADGSTGFTNGVSADQVGNNANPINPLLGSLQMNGGLTPTHTLLPGSPAIDQGNCFGIHADQRGHHRPQNYSSIPNAPGGDGSDIGAFELDTPLIPHPPGPSSK